MCTVNHRKNFYSLRFESIDDPIWPLNYFTDGWIGVCNNDLSRLREGRQLP
jgi:hypothetical protein